MLGPLMLVRTLAMAIGLLAIAAVAAPFFGYPVTLPPPFDALNAVPGQSIGGDRLTFAAGILAVCAAVEIAVRHIFRVALTMAISAAVMVLFPGELASLPSKMIDLTGPWAEWAKTLLSGDR